MFATSSKIKNNYAHHDNFDFMVLIRWHGILVSERRWSAHQCWWALEWLKSPILEWQSLLQLEQM